MTGQVWVELAIGMATVVLSVLGSAVLIAFFLGGMRSELNMVKGAVQQLPAQWKQEIAPVIERLAKLEGMFTLVPSQQSSHEPPPTGMLGRKARRWREF